MMQVKNDNHAKPFGKVVEKMSVVNLMPEITRENGVSVFDTFSMHFNKEYLRLAVYTLNPAMEQQIQELQQNEETTKHIELPTSALIQMNYGQAIDIMMGLGIIIQNQKKADVLDSANLEKLIENVESFLKYLKDEEHGRSGRE